MEILQHLKSNFGEDVKILETKAVGGSTVINFLFGKERGSAFTSDGANYGCICGEVYGEFSVNKALGKNAGLSKEPAAKPTEIPKTEQAKKKLEGSLEPSGANDEASAIIIEMEDGNKMSYPTKSPIASYKGGMLKMQVINAKKKYPGKVLNSNIPEELR